MRRELREGAEAAAAARRATQEAAEREHLAMRAELEVSEGGPPGACLKVVTFWFGSSECMCQWLMAGADLQRGRSAAAKRLPGRLTVRLSLHLHRSRVRFRNGAGAGGGFQGRRGRGGRAAPAGAGAVQDGPRAAGACAGGGWGGTVCGRVRQLAPSALLKSLSLDRVGQSSEHTCQLTQAARPPTEAQTECS
jgi:hypothetical protein